MPTPPSDLGPFGDIVDAVKAMGPLFPDAPLTRDAARDVLRFTYGDEQPMEFQSLRTWEADGVSGEELSWSVGFGPRTYGFLLKPAGASGKLPGIVACYDHGHYKFHGKEKIADGPDGALAAVQPFRDTYYSGRAFANALAREGFVVLAHDTFLWGSRKFPIEEMPEGDVALAETIGVTLGHGEIDAAVLRYHGAAFLHEHQIAKYLNLLGTNLAAVTAYEDRVALNLLAARDDVEAGRIGCVGFSGGGLRASALGATADGLKARVIAGMMATYEELLSRHIVPHTWMLFPAGLSRHGDLADLAGVAAPAPLLVQYALDDVLFTAKGMRDADARIRGYYERAGAPDAYRGQFYPGLHRFDLEMQEAAFGWLKESL